MSMSFLVFCAFSLPCFAFAPDSIVALRVNGKTSFPPCTLLSPQIKTLSVIPEAAIHGPLGFRISSDQSAKNYGGCEVPLLKDHWFSFDFRLDSCSFPFVDSGFVTFLTYQAGRASLTDHFLYYLSFSLYKPRMESRPFLAIAMRASKEISRLNDSCVIPIISRKAYCLESHFVFFTEDSVRMEFYLEGKRILTGRYFMQGEKKRMGIGWLKKISDNFNVAHYSLSLDGFLVSDSRRYAMPPKPGILRVSVDSIPEGFDDQDVFAAYQKTVIVLDTLGSGYPGQSLRSARWRLFQGETDNIPLYDITAMDPAEFFKLAVPFPLDSGIYRVQAAWENNFRNWSGWSAERTFQVDRQRSVPAIIKDVFFSEADEGSAVTAIVSGKWYNLHVFMEQKAPHPFLGYLLVYLNSAFYTLGSPVNKGGTFQPSSNYVINLSFGKDGAPALFEKSTEGSEKSSKLLPDSCGVYIDGRKGEVMVDSAAGHIRLKVRVLDQARPAVWNLTAYMVSSVNKNIGLRTREVEENYSNIFRKKIEVAPILSPPDTGKTKRVLLVSFFIVILIISLFVLIRNRRKEGRIALVNCGKAEKDFELIAEYIRLNLSQKLSVKSICTDLKISKDAFQAAFKVKNEVFLSYLTRLRIEKAKQLLVETDETASKIAFDLGFMESQYFGKVFKKQEGVSPGDFRKKMKPGSKID